MKRLQLIGSLWMIGALTIPFALHAQPDLVPVSLSAPAEAVSEHRISVSWTVENRGDGLASPYWYDQLYWSTNDTWEASDAALSTWAQSAAVAPGTNYVASATVTVPTVMPGTYYLIARADFQDALHETDEANNTTAAWPLVVRVADLRAVELSGPAEAVSERQITATWTVENRGDGLASPYWYDQLYWSTNDTWEASDAALSTWAQSAAVAPGTNYVASATVTVPTVMPGTYYLIARVDFQDALHETDEANNLTAAWPLVVRVADLRAVELSGPAEAVSERQITATWTVENRGDGLASPYWYDQLYWSTNDTWEASDAALSTWAQSAAVAPGTNYVASATVTVPTVMPGTYYLIARVDFQDALHETDEANNLTAAWPLVVRVADLRAVELSGPAEAVSERQITATWTVENRGDGLASPYWYDQLYWSTNDTWEASDAALSTWAQSAAVAPGTNYVASATVTVPTVMPGTYYLIARVDFQDALHETDEANNLTAAWPLVVRVADLRAVELSAPAEAVSERQITATWTVENRGDGLASPYWYDQLYWSTNDTWEASDAALSTWAQSAAVAPGTNYVASATVTVPTVMPGTYYLIVRADFQDGLHETDEANNTVSRSIIVTPAGGFRITAIELLANGRIRVAFVTIGGLAYGLESSTSLAAASWQPQAFYPAPDSAASLSTTPGTGSEVSVYLVPSGDHRFYRAVAR